MGLTSKWQDFNRAVENSAPMRALRWIGEKLQAINHSKGAHDLTGWIAHGATELANFNAHGHAAPMYSHGVSPAEDGSPYQTQQQTEYDKHNQSAEQRDAAHDKLDRAKQAMQSRMESHQQPPEQGMSK